MRIGDDVCFSETLQLGDNIHLNETKCVSVSVVGLPLLLTIAMAHLISETAESDFRNVKDFQSCRINPDDVCIPKGGAVEAYWNRAIEPRCI